MSFLKDKNVLIGITASIAAYKSAFLIREFIKKGANVRVIQTTESQQFITPLTLSTLSKNPVLVELTKEDGKIWNNHVEIGLWADLFVIAPVTAKTSAGTLSSKERQDATICISSLIHEGKSGLIGLSINLAIKVALSGGRPSLLIKPPGILPAAYSFSS